VQLFTAGGPECGDERGLQQPTGSWTCYGQFTQQKVSILLDTDASLTPVGGDTTQTKVEMDSSRQQAAT